ncbi:Long-chain-fatty-acid--CoA/3-oxocholest-4-en-26-oate--CoA ligase [Mycolicibacterium vanbaalenii]|uniref:Long-chain-fatty-acid--CoA/3-oxocholest-4-en-26-oate--CoA ligase n=1 Tax=Mycolicibacterium vanbaalenii TaxID=110539 RepID=A0A5S9NVX9_MYCVN|nr:acyl-CoA synthetase [Mycolicibacterium vanbaalenii]CAA0094879.1 Long-chain-fatty-acid--CoA/3-oxocholest-4-en-26-oate--CoA ligase [Mycolicibacterium vanbaalenii]
MGEWTIGDVVDAIADVIGDRTMTVCGERRTTYADMAQRTRQFANFLAGRGFGAHRERDELDNWECGQDRIALIMYNDRYPEAVIGALKARTVPVNVNHHYTPREAADLLGYVKPRAVIYHRALGAKFADVLPPAGCELMIAVDDGSDVPPLPGSVDLDQAVAQGDPHRRISTSPDDVIMYCTGGTTGRPKGVLWRQSDTYVSSMVGADHESATEIHDKVSRNDGPPWFAVSPLMHAAGLWTVFSGTLAGSPVVLYDDRARFDPQLVWRTAEQHKVGLMTMVGDAYAAPLIEELNRESYQLSSIYAIGTGGAATNPKHVSALLEKLPQLTIINGYGSSETGNMGFGHNQRGSHRETFDLREGGTVVSGDMTRFLRAGEPEIGWVVRKGRIPLGYLDDPEATRRTFPVVEGQRVVVSGDRASLEPDGTLRLYGRDSLVVNTGGEKVFVEEVEAVLRSHPGVADALVVGRDSDRWGQEVVALVQLDPGQTLAPETLHAACTEELARFKAPKEFIVVDEVRRLGNGKADYRWAKSEASRP